MKNINSAKMKKNNAKLVLDTIFSSKTITRKDLANKIGLTPASITNIVNEFIRDGLIIETGIEESQGGRCPTLLSLNPKKYYFIGAELSAKRINCVLTDFHANILSESHRDINAHAGVEPLISQLVSDIETIIKQYGLTKDKIKGLGLSTPGPCDIQHGVVINPPNLTGWNNVPIKQMLEDRIGIHVEFEKETAAAALCEYWFGQARKSKCMLLCAVYEVGIGCSVMIDGEIFHGFHQVAGEIGHMMVDMDGPQCGCGNFGCLEAMADGRALVAYVKGLLNEDQSLAKKYGIENPDDLSLLDVLRRAEDYEKPFYDALIRCAMFVAMAIYNVIVTISPDTIVLIGDVPDNSPLFIDEVRRIIYNKKYPVDNSTIRMYNSNIKMNIDALGGVAMNFEKIFK